MADATKALGGDLAYFLTPRIMNVEAKKDQLETAETQDARGIRSSYHTVLANGVDYRREISEPAPEDQETHELQFRNKPVKRNCIKITLEDENLDGYCFPPTSHEEI